MSPIRVLLADSLPVCLHGLRHVLGAAPDLEIVGAVQTGEDLVALAIARCPHVIVLDLELGGIGGIVALERVRAAAVPPPRVVFVSARGGDWTDLAFTAGASAALDKRGSLDELPAIVREVAAGRVFRPATAPAENSPAIKLTGREIEVLRYIVSGRSSREIASAIGTAQSTVDKHRESIRKKARLHNTVEIVKFGLVYFMNEHLRDEPEPHVTGRREGDPQPTRPYGEPRA